MNNTRTLRSTLLQSSLVSSRLLVVAALVVLFTTTVFASSTPAGTFDRTLQVSGPVNLEVLTHSGDVTVRAGASGSVTIHGKIYMSDRWNILPGVGVGGNRDNVHMVEQNPPIRQEGNSVHIDYVEVKNISVDYEITVPADTTIRTHSGSGDQTIEGTHGNVDVQTGSGDVKLRNLTGEVTLQTGSGDVRAREISGPVKGGTGSGDVEIEEKGAGDIYLHTGSGNIIARGVQGGFRGETGSGDVTAEGTQSGSWEIHTGSGNVHVQLPSNAAFDADISTSSGTVDVDSPIEMTVQGRVGDTHKQIRGKVRGGGPLLRVHTGSGDIHIA
jgi:Putative adhesin